MSSCTQCHGQDHTSVNCPDLKARNTHPEQENIKAAIEEIK